MYYFRRIVRAGSSCRLIYERQFKYFSEGLCARRELLRRVVWVLKYNNIRRRKEEEARSKKQEARSKWKGIL